MSREVMQQALEALNVGRFRNEDVPTVEAACDALRAALAEQKCPCGDRSADQCPGEWEPGCDLGANEKHAKVAEQAQPVAYRHLHEDGWEYYDAPTADDCAECQPLYTTPPAPVVPQPLTDEELDVMWRSPMSADWEHREYGRLVEAEVRKRLGAR